MDCADSMALLTCHCYSRGGGALEQLRIKAMGPEAEGSRWAVPWRDESGLLEPS